MKEIKRYIIGTNGRLHNVESGEWLDDDDVELVKYTDIEQLLAKIEELEAEKEMRYQEGKSEIISKLINDVPDPQYIDEFINQFTICNFNGDYKDISWNKDKLNQYFDVDSDFESLSKKIKKLLLFIRCGSVCLDTGYITKKEFFETILSNEFDKDLNVYLKKEINEIKAQGVEEFIKNCLPYERNMGALDDGTMVTWHCYNIHHLTNYIEKLRTKHN